MLVYASSASPHGRARRSIALSNPLEAIRVQPSQRLLSLDVLRGLDVALMILVNDPGGRSYYQLDHAPWDGCTLTDLVFPTFLFMVGVSIVFAFRTRIANNVPRSVILMHTFKRAALIIGIGWLGNLLPYFHFSTMRYFGVLPRIGLCYAIAALIYLFGRVRGSAIAIVVALVGYWYLMTHVAVPGFGPPTHDIDPAGNIGSWFDRQLMSTNHFYQHKQFDPEGLLSTVPAVATTLLGVLVGVWIQTKHSVAEKTAWLTGAGAVLIGLGLAWSLDFPINKRVWTSSYVLFVGGIAMIALAALYFIIDRKPRAPGEVHPLHRWMYPWLVFGSNALTAYCVAELLAITIGYVRIGGLNLHHIAFSLIPTAIGPEEVRSLLFAILFVAVCFIPMLVLYRKKIFLRL